MSTDYENSILSQLENQLITPDISTVREEYLDADEELRKAAEFIKNNTAHHSELDVDRIKFMYTTVKKKEGGRFVVGQLEVRTAREKVINDQYDYIISIYQPIWKDLNEVNKIIQLDKVLCGVNVETNKEGVTRYKKSTPESREFINNLNHYGNDKVIQSSDLIHQIGMQVEEKMKEERKELKNGSGVDFNKFMNQ